MLVSSNKANVGKKGANLMAYPILSLVGQRAPKCAFYWPKITILSQRGPQTHAMEGGIPVVSPQMQMPLLLLKRVE